MFALDRLSSSSPVAARASAAEEDLPLLPAALDADELGSEALVGDLVRVSGVWWSPRIYAELPVLTPWCVRDRSCRYDQGPESWGAPRADGYMHDDNSIVKEFPFPIRINAPVGHPYRGRRP